MFIPSPSIRTGFAALLLCALAQPALALADDEARRAILDLRAQLKQITEQNQQARIQLADQMDRMQQEILQLRGRIEELGARGAMAAQGSASGPANAPGVDPGQVAIDPQERVVYEAAADLYRNGRYRDAAAGFAAFAHSYPGSALAADALFYMGSSQYAAKDYQASIQTMASLVQNSPDYKRAPDALLVAATSQVELNDFAAAKKILQKIITDYPGSQAAENAKNRINLL